MWKDILKRKGTVGKAAIRIWIKNFIKEHLESMAVGEKITTDEMIELLNENIRDGTYLASATIRRPETQVRFPPNTNFDKWLTSRNIGTILMRQNTDIVDVPKTLKGRSKGYVVRK
jgi:hypothetical protein|tara:strand:+ start:423 stop:770 length:348 start_codon:yes stop_codon:yes gene_type:complete